LKALKPILDALPDEEGSEDEMETMSVKDFTVGVKVFYPKGEIQRESYRTQDGKKVPQHHWRVYDLIQQIPVGKVTTYKVICDTLGEGSPRSVGTALANNPFAPFIPCHRIIASNRTIGGFCGEKPKSGSKNRPTMSHCDWKLRMLRLEGVKFDHQGRLVGPSLAMWQP